MELNIKPLDTIASAAKEFLQKVITPPLEELGLLVSDQVKLWRFKNQVSILTKAQDFLAQKNIKTRKVSLKVLTPLLEDCSMEEDASMQTKWAALIANTVSEGSAIDNPLYSHILSQLSSADAELFEIVFNVCTTRNERNSTVVVIHAGSTINLSELRKFRKDLDFQLDNLMRLRLVKEQRTYDSGMTVNIVGLTDLGFRFRFAVSQP